VNLILSISVMAFFLLLTWVSGPAYTHLD
jgi:hypothetical protein